MVHATFNGEHILRTGTGSDAHACTGRSAHVAGGFGHLSCALLHKAELERDTAAYTAAWGSLDSI